MDSEIFISYAHADDTPRQPGEDCFRLSRWMSFVANDIQLISCFLSQKLS